MDISHLLEQSGAKWIRCEPASLDSIQHLVDSAALEFPEEYLAFLAYSNGGGGELGVNPGWFQLWPAEEVVDLNQGYEVEMNIPGFFGFGSNGGGELLAFDARQGRPWPIVMVPFIPMRVEEAIVIADDFAAFILAIGSRYAGA